MKELKLSLTEACEEITFSVSVMRQCDQFLRLLDEGPLWEDLLPALRLIEDVFDEWEPHADYDAFLEEHPSPRATLSENLEAVREIARSMVLKSCSAIQEAQA